MGKKAVSLGYKIGFFCPRYVNVLSDKLSIKCFDRQFPDNSTESSTKIIAKYLLNSNVNFFNFVFNLPVILKIGNVKCSPALVQKILKAEKWVLHYIVLYIRYRVNKT